MGPIYPSGRERSTRVERAWGLARPESVKNFGRSIGLATIAAVLRLMRSLLSVALLIGGLWAMFSVDLGGQTFAEHMDTISETPEAQQLVEGTRSRVNPALEELRDRLLGEYVEAPTHISGEPVDPEPGREAQRPKSSERVESEDTTLASGSEPALPGRRGPRAQPVEVDLAPPLPGRRPASILDEDPSLEPPLPGRR